MDDLKQLNLTEKDFELILAGLDFLPKKDVAGEMIADIFSAIVAKSEADIKKHKENRERQNAQKKRDQNALVEDIKILQGKLLLLKRHLATQGALSDAYDIINSGKKD